MVHFFQNSVDVSLVVLIHFLVGGADKGNLIVKMTALWSEMPGTTSMSLIKSGWEANIRSNMWLFLIG